MFSFLPLTDFFQFGCLLPACAETEELLGLVSSLSAPMEDMTSVLQVYWLLQVYP